MRFSIRNVSEQEVKREIRHILEEVSSDKDEISNKHKPTTVVKPVDFENIDLNYLFSLNGAEFVRSAYRLVLGREPDPQGIEYFLSKLFSGEYTKGDVIVHLRLSKEGRKRKTKIKGFYKLAIPFFLKRVPIISKFYNLGKFLIFPERFLRRLIALENFSYTHILELKHELYILKQSTNEKIRFLEEITSPLRKIEVNNIWTKEFNFGIENKENFYASFENAFRGGYESIKEKQKIYLDILKKEGVRGKVLDVGCGRGEFLELLKQEGFEGIGIDVNNYLIDLLKKRGFKVFNMDAISFLEQFDEALDAITAFQVIEHMSIKYLKKFLELSYKKLSNGGLIILETINPWNIEAFARFYLDETHVRPIVPEYLYFLLKYIGFKDVKVIFLSPLEKEIFSFQKLKYYYLDYAVIGKKEE
ncbi:methyltransferase domain-containing protein [Aquifex aeolicus]|uniref:DUF4214 domain-containing protein n=1 Tax=Aquifex aeolicus (strain VF5) TaxID=224324 RepID=O67172_AQUAE|nr:methyltransferase domain-containing protein [Aquifex aeolicus]AAC07137.1 putative protein [Aquifex aeolicus VF5]